VEEVHGAMVGRRTAGIQPRGVRGRVILASDPAAIVLPVEPPVRLLAVLGAALVLAWSVAGLALGGRRRLAAGRLRRRVERALALEAAASVVLEGAGYRVVDAQVSRELVVQVDGEELGYEVRADYVVEDEEGARFVAEVKTGEVATDPLHVATRRQLLEYQVGYAEVEGVLLVDMERGRVRRVVF
jgi:hypothetical protein